MVRESNPGRNEIFRISPDRPWGTPSPLYNAYWVIYNGKAAEAWRWPPTPHLWYDDMIWYDMIWYDMIWYDMIWYDMIWYLFNRIWVDTRWQHHTTHLQQKLHTIHREYNSGSAGRAPSLRVIPWHLPYNWGKSTKKTSVRVAQYKNNEQAQRTNTIQEQYKNNNKHRTRTEAPYNNMNHHNTRTMNKHQNHEIQYPKKQDLQHNTIT